MLRVFLVISAIITLVAGIVIFGRAGGRSPQWLNIVFLCAAGGMLIGLIIEFGNRVNAMARNYVEHRKKGD